jgi:hypothetical protein
MILKKIPIDQDKAGRKSKATNICDLTEYVAVPDKAARLARSSYHTDDDGVILGDEGEQAEKLLYLTTRAFNTTTFKGQQAEMVALAMECTKSKYPIQHWVASWHEGELNRHEFPRHSTAAENTAFRTRPATSHC